MIQGRKQYPEAYAFCFFGKNGTRHYKNMLLNHDRKKMIFLKKKTKFEGEDDRKFMQETSYPRISRI